MTNVEDDISLVKVLVVAGVAILIFGALTVTGFGTRWLGTRVDREILVTSHQYQEARSSELTTYRAQLAQLESRRNGEGLTDAQRADVDAQIASLTVLMGAARNR